MNSEWSLKELYSGYDDPEFLADIGRLEECVAEYIRMAGELNRDQAAQSIHNQILASDAVTELFYKLHSFCSLNESVNSADKQAADYLEKIIKILQEQTKAAVTFEKFVADVDDLEGVIASDELLSEYAYLLMRIKEGAAHNLSEEAEEAVSKLSLSGASSWEKQRSYLTSMLKVDYNGEELTLSAVRNLAYDKNQAVRKAAYEAELLSYAKVRDAAAFSLNNIKQQTLTMAKLRRYESPLEKTLWQSRMKQDTLTSMFTAMKEYFPKFWQYLRRKGELLGHKNGLPWYDLFAPIGGSSRHFSAEQARDYLVSVFSGFAEDLALMVKRAFDEAWIDFYPRKGKQGGAFCADLYCVGQSRILTNFDGTLSDVVTLAHELGHAYHNKQISGNRIGNTDYPMPVAETASTFNENVVMDAAIAAASKEERIGLIESQLQDVTQIICDIYSRYLFESAVISRKAEGFMFADELDQMMLDAQKEAYGNGLDTEYLHPSMWICKQHYYFAGLDFYNFPYAFGGLFARGLYAKYQEEGEAFLPEYRALLKATGTCSVEDAAAMAGIDLSKPDFFRKSLKSYADRVDEFLKLTEGMR